MNTTALLADFAQVADGKLYILGGGWSVARFSGVAQMALAIRVLVPWNQANEKHNLRVILCTEDGTYVTQGEGTVEIRGDFEVGRPAGVPKGSDLDAMFAFQVGGISLSVGSYFWQIYVNDEPTARASFRVLE